MMINENTLHACTFEFLIVDLSVRQGVLGNYFGESTECDRSGIIIAHSVSQFIVQPLVEVNHTSKEIDTHPETRVLKDEAREGVEFLDWISEVG